MSEPKRSTKVCLFNLRPISCSQLVAETVAALISFLAFMKTQPNLCGFLPN